jgi:hypothetical protein
MSNTETRPAGHKFLIFVIIYGLKETLNGVRQSLDEANLYLQHPFAFDTNVPYQNPQCLVRPGETMQHIVGANEETNEEANKKHISLNQNKVREELVEIFDVVEGPENYTPVAVSDQVKTILKT